jgi:hypothetical protein
MALLESFLAPDATCLWACPAAALTPETAGVLLSPRLGPSNDCPLCGHNDCYADEVSATLARLSRTFIQAAIALKQLRRTARGTSCARTSVEATVVRYATDEREKEQGRKVQCDDLNVTLLPGSRTAR